MTTDSGSSAANCCSRLMHPAAIEIDELALVWATVFGSCRFRRRHNLKNIFTTAAEKNIIFTAGEGKIIGFVHLQAGKNKRIWHNRGIGVLPSYQGQGVGRNLLTKAVSFARQQRITAIISYVNKINLPALALHARLGFKRDFSPAAQRSKLRHRLLLEP